MNNQTMTFTPEQLRKQAQEMLRQAEQLEKNRCNKRCHSSGYGASAQGTDAGKTPCTKSSG